MLLRIKIYFYLIVFGGCIFLQSATLAAEPAVRLISLKPNITEIIFELGLGDQLVGVTTYCDTPAAAQKIDKVADYVHTEIEKVMLQKPTLVLASEENGRSNEVNFLKKEGLTVRIYPFGRMNDVLDSILQISKDLNVEPKGRELVDRMKRDLAVLKQTATQILGPKDILMVVGARPLVVVGGNNLLNDLLTELGLKNIAGASNLRYPTFSTEQLVVSRASHIVDLSLGMERSEPGSALEWYRPFSSIPAVQNKRIYFLNAGDFRPSPRIVTGAQKLIRELQTH